jgi:hypothetical protein
MSNNNSSEIIWGIVTTVLSAILGFLLVAYGFEVGFVIILAVLTIGSILLVNRFVAFRKKRALFFAGLAGLLVILLVGYIWLEWCPTFQVNIYDSNLVQTQTYEVTDALIRSQATLVLKDFQVKPYKIEIIPKYHGHKVFGNVLLRMTGTVNQDFLLWDSFERDTKPVTQDLALKDVISISGIRQNKDELATNLAIDDPPYQEEIIYLEVIIPSNTGNPFRSRKEIKVSNTPWLQRSTITTRDDIPTIDYSLTNLGTAGEFGYSIGLMKVGDEITTNNAVWSGTDEFSYVPFGELISLKSGDTYTRSIQLDKDSLGKEITRGRYVIQIYTYKKLNQIAFSNPENMLLSTERWYFANQGDVLNLVVCNNPGKTCDESFFLPLEKIPSNVYPYDGPDAYHDPGMEENGFTYFQNVFESNSNESTIGFDLDYWIDPSRKGWAGFTINFKQAVDLSTYRALQFDLQFIDPTAPIGLVLFSDAPDSKNSVENILGDGDYGRASIDRQEITIPFSEISGINFHYVKGMNFYSSEYLTPDTKHHRFVVKRLRFIR